MKSNRSITTILVIIILALALFVGLVLVDNAVALLESAQSVFINNAMPFGSGIITALVAMILVNRFGGRRSK